MSLCDKCSAECRNKPMLGEIIIQCGAYKPPQTNADRIRAMSDEELAELLILSPEIEFGVCRYCKFGNPIPDDRGICLHDSGCLAEANCEAFKKWLQQPAEEDK